MKSSIMIIVFAILCVMLHAQYDEKQILIQQANQRLAQRQYAEAEGIFLQILEKFPNDLSSILQLMNIYLSLNQGDKAETLLSRYQRALPQSTYSEQRIQMLLMQGKLNEARSEIEAYLALHGEDINKYRMIASYYERRNFHDAAIEIYERARRVSGKDIYSLEIANAAMQAQRPQRALQEYLSHMATATNINHYIKNQIKSIVTADSSLVSVVKDFATGQDSAIIKELYAYALVNIQDYPRALEIYKDLPETYLRDFALEQLRLKNYEVALPAYRHLAGSNNQPFQKQGFQLEVARILYAQAEYDSSSAVLREIIADPFWNQNPGNQRNPLYVSIRRLIAQNAMARGEDIETVKALTEEAKNFANQAQTRQELELELARLAILSGNFANAESRLSNVNLAPVLPQRDYLLFLSAFLQNNAAHADSLMNEYMLKHPGDDYANDIIYLNMLSINMQPPQQKRFADGIALLQQMKPAGVDSLYSIYTENRDEELLLLAVEWAIGMSMIDKAEAMLQNEFDDPLAAEYAAYLRLALSGTPEEELALAKDFLKSKPNSIFSPGFRQVISRVANSRISL